MRTITVKHSFPVKLKRFAKLFLVWGWRETYAEMVLLRKQLDFDSQMADCALLDMRKAMHEGDMELYRDAKSRWELHMARFAYHVKA